MTTLPLTIPQVVATVLTLIGLLICFAAIATPAWQVVYAREIEQWVQSGLWLNCQTRPNGMHACVYTFTNADFDFYTSPEINNFRSPPFYAWQRYLLWAFLSGQFLGLLALISLPLSFQEKGIRRLGAVLFVAAVGASVLVHVVSVVSFMFISQMVEYRFYHVSVSGIYEKHRGYSFLIELAGLATLVLALIFAIVHFCRMTNNDLMMNHRNEGYSRNSGPNLASTTTDREFFDPSDFHGPSSWESKFAMRELPPVPPPPGLGGGFSPYSGSSLAGGKSGGGGSFKWEGGGDYHHQPQLGYGSALGSDYNRSDGGGYAAGYYIRR